MSRDVIPLTIDDLSAFAKRLRSTLSESPTLPGHAAFLGHIAKAAGYQNFQHLKSGPSAPAVSDASGLPQPDTGTANPAHTAAKRAMERALRVFDAQGIMAHWPKHYSAQGLALWVFWSDLTPKTDLTEAQVNNVLKLGSSFGDHVLLRRSLIDHKLVQRTTDGRVYRRIENQPPPEAVQLIRMIRARKAAP